MVPHIGEKPFIMGSRGDEAWISLLIKGLAKYCGTYDDLRNMKLDRLSAALFGMQPFEIGRAFTKVHKPKSFKLSGEPNLSEKLYMAKKN